LPRRCGASWGLGRLTRGQVDIAHDPHCHSRDEARTNEHARYYGRPKRAIALVSDTASAQQPQRWQVRRPAPAERTNTTLDAVLPSPPVDKTSALGQALAACNQESDLQEGLTLPGPKGEITLDRCYKGRAHLVCVFKTLSTEARSLTNTYAKIVDANYPEINSVDGVCKLAPETLASNIVGSEDFAKRFRELKSQYAAAASCAGNVELAFKNVALTDMMQAPEILKSMTASIDGDIAKISEVDKQISDLAEKMEASKKAMKTITKIYHTMCLQGERAAEKPGK
jgi:hypothetical protein